MESSKGLMEKAKACKTTEELLALAKENEIELTGEEAEALLEEFKEGELADEELGNVAGGVEGLKISEPHERVVWKTRGEVQFIFNEGDQVEVFPSWCRHRSTTCTVVARRAYAIGSEKYVDMYYLKRVKGYEFFEDSWHFRDQIEM